MCIMFTMQRGSGIYQVSLLFCYLEVKGMKKIWKRAAALLLALAALGLGLWVRYRTGFLLVGVAGIICCTGREFALANRGRRG